MVNSVVEYYYDNKGYRCGYCRRPDSNYSHGMWAHQLAVSDYQQLVDRGWRRSGKYCYKPTMDIICCPMYTIRCRALEFKPSKSQKKILKKMGMYLTGDGGGVDSAEGSGASSGGAGGAEEGGDGGGDHFVEAARQHTQMDLRNIVIDETMSHRDNRNNTGVTTINVSNNNVASTSKTIKPGLGVDKSKTPCKKAKQLRLERKIEKLQKKGVDINSIQPTNKNIEKQLEDFLEEIPEAVRNKLEVRLVRTSPPSAEWLASAKESHRVYAAYQKTVHGDTPEKCSEPKFRDFLVESPLEEEYTEGGPACGYGSFHQQYWLQGRLVATGVVDILPACVSSVYFYYDPQYRHLTFGTYGALRELAFTRQLHKSCPSIQYYYMGFYIHSCRKMRYKGNFAPSELLCPETYKWFPLKDCIPKLNASPYSRLNPDIDAIDEDDCTESHLDKIPLLIKSRVVPLGLYKRQKTMEKEYLDNMLQYAKLVGAVSASKLILY